VLAGWLLLSGCDSLFGPKALGKAECRPRKLTHVDACQGEDTTFQECHFYFRASGVPDRAWCEALAASAMTSAGGPPVCDFSKPAAWAKVSCTGYQVAKDWNCYECKADELESSRAYLYAYDPQCSRGSELVTCNYALQKAAARLAK